MTEANTVAAAIHCSHTLRIYRHLATIHHECLVLLMQHVQDFISQVANVLA